MTTAEARPSPQGEALAAELRWMHDMIRRDLRTVRQLAADVAAGRPAPEVEAGLRSLAASGPLWQLKVNCLRYRFVRSHHHGESTMLFPQLRRANPDLNPVVDKLEADYRSISGLLDEVGAAARALGERRIPPCAGLTSALQNLGADRLVHLDVTTAASVTRCAGCRRSAPQRGRHPQRSARPSASFVLAGVESRIAMRAATTTLLIFSGGPDPLATSPCGSASSGPVHRTLSAPRPMAGRSRRPMYRRPDCRNSMRSSPRPRGRRPRSRQDHPGSITSWARSGPPPPMPSTGRLHAGSTH